VLIRVEGLPQGTLEAAAQFHAEVLPGIRDALARSENLVLAFPPADHTHRGWRLAAVQQLARQAAPLRVNALAGGDAAAIAAAEAYLAGTPGVTGQLLRLDSAGAGEVLSNLT
jgi:hypothetical protein